MKNLAYILLLSMVFMGCGSSKKQLQKGNYDLAIDKSVKNLMKKPTDQEEIEILDRAYRIANEQDLERIRYLKLENNPNNWDEILNRYIALKNRQSKVRTVLPLQMGNRTIDYEYVDFDAEIVKAKQGAASYFYEHAQQLMNNGDKESYRTAYYELMKVKEYAGSYENVDELLMQAKNMGMSRVLIMMQNNSVLKLPPEYEQELLAISPADLNSEWVEYHTRDLDENIEYDYHIYVNLNSIEVSPDHVAESDRMVERKVEDGWEYVLDARGNVMKDTAGNDIKVPKYKTLTCTVIETLQKKSVMVQGDVEIIQLNPTRVLRKDPIGAESTFEHHSARAVGDVNALDKEDQELIKLEPLPFPTDVEMVFRGTETLKMAIRDILYRNRRYII
ncbi:MAG: hypothetical protein ACP5D1_03865 [Bacteroidales bacterium]